MNIQEFVETAINDVQNAVEKCSKQHERDIHIAKKTDNSCIDFDLAVTVEESGNAKAAIKVLGINTETITQLKNSIESRIKFSVYIPSQTNQERNTQRRAFEKLKHKNY